MATLLAIAGNRSEDAVRGGGDDEGGDLDDYELWREIKKQVKLLRDDMDTRDRTHGSRIEGVEEDLSWKTFDHHPVSENPVPPANPSAAPVPHPKLPFRPRGKGNPRLNALTVDCDSRHAPLITDGGLFLDSRFDALNSLDLV